MGLVNSTAGRSDAIKGALPEWADRHLDVLRTSAVGANQGNKKGTKICLPHERSAVRPEDDVSVLRNIGTAMRADLVLLGVSTVGELARRDADQLYLDLCVATGARHDPCVHDTFAAAIHQAKTGEALAWWDFTAARKARQRQGTFVQVAQAAGD